MFYTWLKKCFPISVNGTSRVGKGNGLGEGCGIRRVRSAVDSWGAFVMMVVLLEGVVSVGGVNFVVSEERVGSLSSGMKSLFSASFDGD